MGYRVLFLANPVKLSMKNEQLMIDNGEIARIPLEDIECIVCDTLQLNITARLLTKFAEYAITFYIVTIQNDKKLYTCTKEILKYRIAGMQMIEIQIGQKLCSPEALKTPLKNQVR